MVEQKKVRVNPRISVNKLGEYLLAGPSKRKRVVFDQKYPRDFIVARYTLAENAMVKFLSNQADRYNSIYADLQRILNLPAGTPWELQRNQLCSDAIEKFLDMEDKFSFQGLNLIQADNDLPNMTIKGVEISIKPEFFLSGENKKREKTLGALIIYLSKTNPLNQDSGEYITSLLKHYLEAHFSTNGKVDTKICFVADIFAGEIFAAPSAYKRRQQDIEAACEEISRTWQAV